MQFDLERSPLDENAINCSQSRPGNRRVVNRSDCYPRAPRDRIDDGRRGWMCVGTAGCVLASRGALQSTSIAAWVLLRIPRRAQPPALALRRPDGVAPAGSPIRAGSRAPAGSAHRARQRAAELSRRAAVYALMVPSTVFNAGCLWANRRTLAALCR
jgi:hypothetical protein